MRCPECNSKKVVKSGKRKTQFGSKQRYLCRKCGKRFVEQQSLKYKTYPFKAVYEAINFYNLGFNGREVSKKVNKICKVKTSKSTIYTWANEFQDICPISKVRNSFAGYENVLYSKNFEHENLDFEFLYHKYKLDAFVKNRFPSLAGYITRFEQGCPDVFFEVGERCSRPMFEVYIEGKKKVNLACKMAAFAEQAAKDNRERHKLVGRFMIINDKATVACEIPVWYWEKSMDVGVTGHIDILQVRNDLVYILDYKPDASKDSKAAKQLYHYASALSFRTKIPLNSIRCAWFDENMYYEYNPFEANATLIKNITKK